MAAINTSPRGLNPSSRLPSSPEARLESKVKGLFRSAQICGEAPRQYVFDKVMRLDPSEFDEAIAISNRLMLEKTGAADPLNRVDLLCQRVREGLEISAILYRDLNAQGNLPFAADLLTDLEIAAILGYTQLVELLHSRNGMMPISHILSFALYGKQVELTEHILNKEDLDLSGPPGALMLPLQVAIASDMESFVGRLINKGCNVNARDGSGVFPLTIAANKGKIAVMDFLYIYGAMDKVVEGDRVTYVAETISAEAPDEAVEKLLRAKDTNDAFQSGKFHIPYLMLSTRLFRLCARLLPNSAEIIRDEKNLWTEAVAYPLNDEQIQALSAVLDINAEDARGLTALDIAGRGQAQTKVRKLIDNGANCLSSDRQKAQESLECAVYDNDEEGALELILTRCFDRLEVEDPTQLFSLLNDNLTLSDISALVHFAVLKGEIVDAIWSRIISTSYHLPVFNALKEKRNQDIYSVESFCDLLVFANFLGDFACVDQLLTEGKVTITLEEDDIRLQDGVLLKKELDHHQIYALLHREELSKQFGSLGHLSLLLHHFPYLMGKKTQNKHLAEMIFDGECQLKYFLGVFDCKTLGELFVKEKLLSVLTDAYPVIGAISREEMWPPYEEEERREPLPFDAFFAWLQEPAFANELKAANEMHAILHDPAKTIMGMPEPLQTWKENFRRSFGEIVAILQEDEDDNRRGILIADFYGCWGQCVTAWESLVSRWQDVLFRVESGDGKSAFYSKLRELAKSSLNRAYEVLAPNYSGEAEGMLIHLPDSIARCLEERGIPAKRNFPEVDLLHRLHEDEEDMALEAFFNEFNPQSLFRAAVDADNSSHEYAITDWALSIVPRTFVTPELLRKRDKFQNYFQGNNLIDALAASNVVVLQGETPERAIQRVVLTQRIISGLDLSPMELIHGMEAHERLPKTISLDLQRRFNAIGISVRNQESGENAIQRVARVKYALELLETNPGEALTTYQDLLLPSWHNEHSPNKKARAETTVRLKDLKEFLEEIASGIANIIPERIDAPKERIDTLRNQAIEQYIRSLSENGSPIHEELHRKIEIFNMYQPIPEQYKALFKFQNIEKMLVEEELYRKRGESLEKIFEREQSEEYAAWLRDEKTEKVSKAAILNALIEEGIISVPRVEGDCFIDQMHVDLISEHLSNPTKMTLAELEQAISSNY